MLDEKLDQLVQMLEKQEMEATNISVTIYTELLAAYLYQGDLNNANYLWKRIPVSVKQGNRELERMRQIYRHLVDNDYPAFYRAMDYEWSRNVAEIMFELKNKVRQECLNTISKTYVTIFQSVLMGIANLTTDQVEETCKSMGWEITTGNDPIIVITKTASEMKVPPATCEAQLAMLTDFISFLEN